jgi:hypothetical protein
MTAYFRTNRLDLHRLTRADVPAFSAHRADSVVWESEFLIATLARENEPVAMSHHHTNHREEHP